jgi:hypothetical protein
VFEEGDFWWSRFLSKKFGHCYLLMCDAYNWLKIEPTVQNLDVKILDYAADFNYIDFLRKRGKVVCEISINTSLIPPVWFPPIFRLSCANIISNIIGFTLSFLQKVM